MQIRRFAWLLLFYFFKLSTFNCSKCLPFSFCIRDGQMNIGKCWTSRFWEDEDVAVEFVIGPTHGLFLAQPAESWFDIHYNDPTIPQEYFRQQLRVNCTLLTLSMVEPLGLFEPLLEVDVGLMDRFWALAKIPLGPDKCKSGLACIGLKSWKPIGKDPGA